MTPFLILLLAAAPAVYWLSRRGRNLGKTPGLTELGPQAEGTEPNYASGFEVDGEARDTVSDSPPSPAKHEPACVVDESSPRAPFESLTELNEFEISCSPADKPNLTKKAQVSDNLNPAALADEVGVKLEAEPPVEDIEPCVEKPTEPGAAARSPEPLVLHAAANQPPVAEEAGRIEDVAPAAVEDEVPTGLEAELTIESPNSHVETPVQPASLPEPRVLPWAVIESSTSIPECESAEKPKETHMESSPTPAVEAEPSGEELEAKKQRSGFSKNGNGRPAQRYRPPVQKPPRTSAMKVNEELSPTRRTQTVSALEIYVHLTFDRSSFCTITFLPKRQPESDQDIEVRSGKETWRLLAQEDWYQDIEPEDMGERLRAGIELTGVVGNQREARWQLKGRDVYVLAAHPRATGYVSAPRMLLGRTDVVLCIEELAGEAEAVLVAAGCEGYTRIGESLGIPHGWVGFRGVLPTNALALDPDADQFYALKPAPDIEIALEGGVCIRNSAWLAGYPPRIKLYGQQGEMGSVLIDGQEASRSEDGSLIVNGYDRAGQHSVYCEGLSHSRTYSIETPPDQWDEWTAFRFGAAGICGPLVQLNTEAATLKLITVPMSNPLLVGAKPGEIFRCSARDVGRWKGFVPFEVVWALPAQPLTSNKKIARIIQLSDTPIMPSLHPNKKATNWYKAILDASRKGLLIESEFANSASRWHEYRTAARRLWRAWR